MWNHFYLIYVIYTVLTERQLLLRTLGLMQAIYIMPAINSVWGIIIICNKYAVSNQSRFKLDGYPYQVQLESSES